MSLLCVCVCVYTNVCVCVCLSVCVCVCTHMCIDIDRYVHKSTDRVHTHTHTHTHSLTHSHGHTHTHTHTHRSGSAISMRRHGQHAPEHLRLCSPCSPLSPLSLPLPLDSEPSAGRPNRRTGSSRHGAAGRAGALVAVLWCSDAMRGASARAGRLDGGPAGE